MRGIISKWVLTILAYLLQVSIFVEVDNGWITSNQQMGFQVWMP